MAVVAPPVTLVYLFRVICDKSVQPTHTSASRVVGVVVLVRWCCFLARSQRPGWEARWGNEEAARTSTTSADAGASHPAYAGTAPMSTPTQSPTPTPTITIAWAAKKTMASIACRARPHPCTKTRHAVLVCMFLAQTTSDRSQPLQYLFFLPRYNISGASRKSSEQFSGILVSQHLGTPYLEDLDERLIASIPISGQYYNACPRRVLTVPSDCGTMRHNSPHPAAGLGSTVG